MRTRELVDPECSIHADWRDVMNANDIDGVIIATPPDLHFEMAIHSISERIPVLVEKPFTMEQDEAEQLRQAANAAGCPVCVDHTHLFSPAYRGIKEHAAGAGPVRGIVGEAGSWGPFRTGVPVLWDWGPHDVAMCIDLLGERPRCKRALLVERRKADGGVGETVSLELSFSQATRASIRIGNLTARKTRRFIVYFDDAVLVYDDQAKHKLVRHGPAQKPAYPAGDGQPVPLREERPLSNVVRAFGEAIRRGSFDAAQVDLAVAVVSALSTCEAIVSGKPGVPGDEQ